MVPCLVSTAAPMTAPMRRVASHGRAGGWVTMRMRSRTPNEARGMAKLSLLTAPLMNRNMGVKPFKTAAPRASHGRCGVTSRPIR